MSLFTKKRHSTMISEAITRTIEHLQSGKLQSQIEDAFNGQFGPEPILTFQISIRRDCATDGKFAYQVSTKIHHEIGAGVKLYGLANSEDEV